MSRALSSFDTLRCSSLDAIVDRQVHRLVPDLLQGARGFELDLALGVLDDAGRFFPRLLTHLLAELVHVRPGGATMDSASVRACARIVAESACTPLQLLLGLARVVQRLADRLLALVERRQQRPPGELRQQRHQHQEGEDGPDVEPWIGLDQRVVHRERPFDAVDRIPGTPLLQQDDEEREHFGEDRHAFKEEQRQVDRAGDLRRRARLTSDRLRPLRPPVCRCPARPQSPRGRGRCRPPCTQAQILPFRSSSVQLSSVMSVDGHANEHGRQEREYVSLDEHDDDLERRNPDRPAGATARARWRLPTPRSSARR